MTKVSLILHQSRLFRGTEAALGEVSSDQFQPACNIQRFFRPSSLGLKWWKSRGSENEEYRRLFLSASRMIPIAAPQCPWPNPNYNSTIAHNYQ